MLGTMYDDLTGMMLQITLILVVRLGVKFWVQRATAGAAPLNDDASRSSASKGTVTLHSQGDGPQRDLISFHAQGGGRWSRSRELKVICGGSSVRLAGAEREPFADIFFRLDCTSLCPRPSITLANCVISVKCWSTCSSGFPDCCPSRRHNFKVTWREELHNDGSNVCSHRSGRHTRVQLTMDQVDFGVRNCCTRNCSARNQSCDKNCKTVFIYKITIKVCPKSWAQHCRRLLLQPHHRAEVFGLQRHSTFTFQMPLVSPRQASVSYQFDKMVSRNAPAFGWSPARRDDATNSVSWTLELYRYTNGLKLELNKVSWGSRPVLAIPPDHMHIPPGSFLSEASWDLQPHAELQLESLEWDVKINLHTAVSQSKSGFPAYSVAMGPMLTFDKQLAF